MNWIKLILGICLALAGGFIWIAQEGMISSDIVYNPMVFLAQLLIIVGAFLIFPIIVYFVSKQYVHTRVCYTSHFHWFHFVYGSSLLSLKVRKLDIFEGIRNCITPYSDRVSIQYSRQLPCSQNVTNECCSNHITHYGILFYQLVGSQ